MDRAAPADALDATRAEALHDATVATVVAPAAGAPERGADDVTSLAAAASSLADALCRDVFYAAVCGKLPADALARYMAASLAEGAVLGRADVAPAGCGAAIWTLPAGSAAAAAAGTPEARAVAKAAKRAAFERHLGAAALAAYDAICANMEAAAATIAGLDGAWYLSILGTAPPAQRRGVARALLAPALRDADAAGAPCWLETFGPEAIPFYERQGFAVVGGPLVEPFTGAAYHILLRAPQQRQ